MTRTTCTAVMGALVLAPSAWGVEALTTVELVSHRDKYHDDRATEDRAFCVCYIQGFVDGAVATDDRVMNSLSGAHYPCERF